MFAARLPHRAVVLAMALASGTAVAGQLDYTAYAGIEHTDNVNLSASQPVSQNILSPGINFSFLQQGSTIQANIVGALEYRHFMSNAFDNQTVAQLNGRLNWTVLPQRLDFTAEDFAGVQPLSTLSSNTPANQQQTNVVTLGPTLYFRLGNTVHGQGELRYIGSDASRTKEFNSSRGLAALRLIKDLNPTDQLSLNLESQHVNYAERVNHGSAGYLNPNYNGNAVYVRYLSQLAHLDIDVAAGWSQLVFHGAPNETSPLLRLTVGWQASPYSNFSISGARQYSDATQELMLPTAQRLVDVAAASGYAGPGSGGISTGDSVINQQVYLDQRVEATYTFTAARFNLTLSPLYGKRSYPNDVSFDQTERGVSGGINYKLTNRLSFLASADVRRLTYRTLQRRDRVSAYEVGLNAVQTRHWSYQLSLTHRERSSNAPDAGYRENGIYFGVSYRR